MRKRTLSREIALKILYACDITKDSITECSKVFWENSDKRDETVKKYSEILITGFGSNKEKIDEVISKYAKNWKLNRMATVDRNILRIAAYELLFSEEVPPKVAINEAIEMAKKFGDNDSSKFVNGLLDKINKTHNTSEK